MQLDYTEISLHNKAGTIIAKTKCSTIDYDVLTTRPWSLTKGGAKTKVPLLGECIMSRVVMVLHGIDIKGLVVDHCGENNDILDNRRQSLRVATTAQNTQNKKKRKGATSDYYGVCLTKDGLFRSKVHILGQGYHLGAYKTEIEAAQAYDTFLLNRPDFAELRYNLNFKNETEESKNREQYKKKQRKSKYIGVCEKKRKFRSKVQSEIN